MAECHDGFVSLLPATTRLGESVPLLEMGYITIEESRLGPERSFCTLVPISY